MNFKIKTSTVGYNNKILISDGNFSLGKNDEVKLTVPAIKSHKTNSLAQKPNFSHEKQEPQPTTHYDEKVALVHFLAGGFTIRNTFRCELVITILRNGISQNLMRLLMFDKLVITTLEMTPDVVYVPINLSLRF